MAIPAPWRPTKEQLQAAWGKRIPSIWAPGLKVVFCGINPSLYSAAVGHHFARPGNRFWPALHGAGFTNRLLSPFEDRLLLERGAGITNLVREATASADDVPPEAFVKGGRRLLGELDRWQPRWLAVLGLGAYRRAFGRNKAGIGPQSDRIGPCRVWVLPSPSGLNASYQLPDLVELFAEFRRAVDE